jgi:hypothetical protein
MSLLVHNMRYRFDTHATHLYHKVNFIVNYIHCLEGVIYKGNPMILLLGLVLLLSSNPLCASHQKTYDEFIKGFTGIQFAPGVRELLETGFRPLYDNAKDLERKSAKEENRHIECLIDELVKCNPEYQIDAVLARLSFHENLLKSLPESDSLKALLEELESYKNPLKS